jgi:hypothetical protein
MRPDRFQTLMSDHLPSVPGIAKTETFADAGYDHSQYGLILHHEKGARSYWQIVATARPGDSYDRPEDEPVTGDRMPEQALPDLSGDQVATAEVEAAIAAAFTRADGAGEATTIERYSRREQPGAISHGLTVDFHDGSRIYVYALATLRRGEEHIRENRHFKVEATL